MIIKIPVAINIIPFTKALVAPISSTGTTSAEIEKASTCPADANSRTNEAINKIEKNAY